MLRKHFHYAMFQSATKYCAPLMKHHPPFFGLRKRNMLMITQQGGWC